MARPSTYDEDIASFIIERLTIGQPLRQICRGEGMPGASTVISWTENNPTFAERYARARTLGLDAIAEEILDISDDGTNDWIEREGATVLNAEHVNRSRLRVDARKWLLSKMRPDKYGDRTVLAGDSANPLTITLATLDKMRENGDSE